MHRPVNCKYTPLENHLRALSATRLELILTFEQIEMAMQSDLPKSAYIRLTWWDNAVQSTLSHKYAWLHAGWQVDVVNLSARWVHFVRRIDMGE
jgi:hypothetical protein